jgi:hypothetical protein
MGQTADNKLTAEEELSFSDLLLPDFPVVEFRPLWKIIWQTSTTYANTPKARIVGAFDIRQLASVRTGAVATSDHGLLTGLTDDDHLQYVHISENRTISASHIISGTLTISNTSNDALTVSGNVGIGTTTPSTKLQVYTARGSIKVDDITAGTGSTDAGITFDGGGDLTSGLFTEVGGKLLSYGINVRQLDLDYDSTRAGGIFRIDSRVSTDAGTGGSLLDKSAFVVYARAENTITEYLGFGIDLNTGDTYLTPSQGNVGIGLTVPSSYKLHVQGDINYTGILRLNGTQLNTTNVPEGTNLYYTSERATQDAIVMAIALG